MANSDNILKLPISWTDHWHWYLLQPSAHLTKLRVRRNDAYPMGHRRYLCWHGCVDLSGIRNNGKSFDLMRKCWHTSIVDFFIDSYQEGE